jgi:hypothetical protein
MTEEITRLSAALAERMRELRADPTDPRLAPLFAQYQALLRQHMTTMRPLRPVCRPSERRRARAPSVRGRQHTVADPLKGIHAGRRRQDQGRLDRVADQAL